MPSDFLIRFPGHAAVCRVRIGAGALDRLGAFTRLATGAERAAVVTDSTVARLYGARAIRSLGRAGIASRLFAVPPGERSKSSGRLERLWDGFAAYGLERGDAVVALGGGVVGDLGGFAAATWLRGVPWVCVPTTLLAQVDSSVGGKTAVNRAAGKNLVGAFHQPAGILADPRTLETLPARQYRAGLAELVKTGAAVDAGLFRWAERHAARLRGCSGPVLAEAVRRALRAKARVVSGDEREREGGGRTALNYGHTLGHALEAAAGYRGLLHGEAVAIGLRVAGALSVRVAGLPPGALRRQNALLEAFGLPRAIPGTRVAKLLRAMALDKKRRSRATRWVLTTRMGRASVPRSISGRLVRAALLEAGARA